MQTADFGLVLIVAGCIILVLAAVMASRKNRQEGNVKAAGVIMIGPVPIIFGTDRDSAKKVLVLAIVLTALAIVLVIVHNFL